MAEAIDPHWRVLVYLAAYTGLRAGELWGLRRQDVDLLRGALRVRQTVRRDVAQPDAPKHTIHMFGREVGPPKNGKACVLGSSGRPAGRRGSPLLSV